jgi:acetyl-CoA acetyltransferase
VDAVRTPIGALGGVLASVHPDDMAALVIKEIVQRNKINPALIPTKIRPERRVRLIAIRKA